jgi:hypothetical protein
MDATLLDIVTGPAVGLVQAHPVGSVAVAAGLLAVEQVLPLIKKFPPNSLGGTLVHLTGQLINILKTVLVRKKG